MGWDSTFIRHYGLIMKKSNKLTERSYFLIQIDHTKEAIPSGIAAKMVGGQNCIKLEVLEIEGNSDKENPYIAF
jgi:hypothetical protein